MNSTCYHCLENLFISTVLGQYNLCAHIDTDERTTDPDYVQADLTVVMWLHSTLADNLMDMVMSENPTACSVWMKIEAFFNTNKLSHAIQVS